jgi:hypothetical protein
MRQLVLDQASAVKANKSRVDEPGPDQQRTRQRGSRGIRVTRHCEPSDTCDPSVPMNSAPAFRYCSNRGRNLQIIDGAADNEHYGRAYPSFVSSQQNTKP